MAFYGIHPADPRIDLVFPLPEDNPYDLTRFTTRMEAIQGKAQGEEDRLEVIPSLFEMCVDGFIHRLISVIKKAKTEAVADLDRKVWGQMVRGTKKVPRILCLYSLRSLCRSDIFTPRQPNLSSHSCIRDCSRRRQFRDISVLPSSTESGRPPWDQVPPLEQFSGFSNQMCPFCAGAADLDQDQLFLLWHLFVDPSQSHLDRRLPDHGLGEKFSLNMLTFLARSKAKTELVSPLTMCTQI